MQGRPQNVQAIGPLHWKAALYDRTAPLGEADGAKRKKGDHLPNPKAMLDETATYQPNS